MAATDFLTLLVNETFERQSDKAIDLSSLAVKLEDYGLNYLRGFFIPQFQILRFKTALGNIDIPINWSIFANDHQDGIILDAHSDQDHLFEIFKTHWLSDIEKLLVTHADGYCYIVGLKAGDEHHLHDLLNPQELLKAA